ncbi:hypothetical protein CYMTET_9831 [Cymbomonas tetramitiformis]|uniref:Indoleamine 2,3-dioxygenase n=1 Tax=Cymbomonas tetramitiformis TaxID=36881 RepID=A0AAE0GQV3_9CHLO|nr:hypothetical protein CYMTET_9831 [Cymbomonas tetramitiformis]
MLCPFKPECPSRPAVPKIEQRCIRPSEEHLAFPGSRFADAVFSIGRERGFLPRVDPERSLPASFSKLQELLDVLPVHTNVAWGLKGLLAIPDAVAKAVNDLPNYILQVETLQKDEHGKLLALLFRGYTFVASAYLLEPAYQTQVSGKFDGKYGKGRSSLPSQVAQPLVCVADKLGQKPWLDYHYAYSLCNYVKRDPTLPSPEVWHWSNLDMACKFAGTSNEIGFIMLHVTINAYGAELIGSIEDSLLASRLQDEGKMLLGLEANMNAMIKINTVRTEMWKASRSINYNDFRVFIMGITGNESIFGDGVVYEGVEKWEGNSMQFRGQTGAQDDIIPMQDIFSGVMSYYPDNKLTEYLLELREYRPVVVQRFFDGLFKEIEASKLHAFIANSASCNAYLLCILQEIYLFRNGHWQFVQRYIMANTRHATATGGTPITSWLLNQIQCVLTYMDEVLRRIRDASLPAGVKERVQEIQLRHQERWAILTKQKDILAYEQYDPDDVYEANKGNFDGNFDDKAGRKAAKLQRIK